MLSDGVYLVDRECLIKGAEVLKKILDDDHKQLEAPNVLQSVVGQLQHPKSDSFSSTWCHRSQGGAKRHSSKYIDDIVDVLLHVWELLVLTLQLCCSRL